MNAAGVDKAEFSVLEVCRSLALNDVTEGFAQLACGPRRSVVLLGAVATEGDSTLLENPVLAEVGRQAVG